MSETKILGRGDFLAAVSNFKIEPVSVPEIAPDAVVYVCELDGAGRLAWNARISKILGVQKTGKKKKPQKQIDPSTSVELMAFMVSMTACDQEGNKLFTEDDVRKLVRTNITVLLALSTKAMELSGLSDDKVEEVAANLKKVRNSDSTDN